jgi:hypothetical protein
VITSAPSPQRIERGWATVAAVEDGGDSCRIRTACGASACECAAVGGGGDRNGDDGKRTFSRRRGTVSYFSGDIQHGGLAAAGPAAAAPPTQHTPAAVTAAATVAPAPGGGPGLWTWTDEAGFNTPPTRSPLSATKLPAASPETRHRPAG